MAGSDITDGGHRLPSILEPEKCTWIEPAETMCAMAHEPGTTVATLTTTEKAVKVVACRGMSSGVQIVDGARVFHSTRSPGFRVSAGTYSGPCHVYPPDNTWVKYDEKRRAARAAADREAAIISRSDGILERGGKSARTQRRSVTLIES